MQKIFEMEGPAAGAGAAKLSKTAKDTQSDTPSTLPKAGAADLRRLRRVPGAALEASTGHDRPLVDS